MRDNSNITATANRGNENGGNININTDTLIALENSDITARAFEGNGGNIQINTQGLFLSPDSEINASSTRGINGVVEIQNLEFDERNSLTPLENNFVDIDQIIAKTCLTRRNERSGSFVITGTGGLPSTPDSTITGYDSLTASENLQPENSHTQAVINENIEWRPGDRIVDSNALVKTPDGQILLVANQPEVQKAEALVCTSENK